MSYSATDHDTIPLTEETPALIASNKVEGTAVYDGQGLRLGSVNHFMVNKLNGRVAYAVLSFGGFFGIGQKYFPLPWNELTYDPTLGGFVVDIPKETLEGAPAYADEANADWGDPTYGRRINDYYGSMVP